MGRGEFSNRVRYRYLLPSVARPPSPHRREQYERRDESPILSAISVRANDAFSFFFIPIRLDGRRRFISLVYEFFDYSRLNQSPIN